MEFGILMGDEPVSVAPAEHLDLLLREVEAAQRNGFTYLTIGQHYLYDGYRWLQPIPLLARLAAELDPGVRLGTTILIAPLYHPVALAEELATLDIVTRGNLVVGLGTGYLPEEYQRFGIPFKERFARLEELLGLLPQLWSQDCVTFSGRFTQLEDAPTHIQPIQQPGPPVWVGAMKEGGVRRAARAADAWTITPQQTMDEVRALIAAYADERAAHGRPLGPLPIRRELMIGRDRDDATRRFERVARGKYIAYADRGMQTLSSQQVTAKFDATVRGHAVLGTAEDCRQQLTHLASRLPVDPVIVRPHWPGMTSQETVAYLDEVGEAVVQPLRDLQPTSFDTVLAEVGQHPPTGR